MKRVTTLAAGVCALSLTAGCNDSAPSAEPLDLRGTPTFAVRLTDYTSAGVALLDGDGKVLSKKFISSGSEPPGLTGALSGDIDLPSEPCTEGVLTLLARAGGNYVLQQDLETSKVVSQIKTQGKSAGSAYSSNPYDILCIEDGQTALVTRHEPNLAKGAPELDRGDDVLVVNLETGKRLRRISLEAFRNEVSGFDFDGNPVDETAYARPAKIVQLGAYAVVGLENLSLHWNAGPAQLALIRLDDEQVSSFALPSDFLSCGFLVKAAGRDDAVVISCTGSPFGNPETAGLLLVSVNADGEASVEASYHPKANGKGGAPFGFVASLGGTRVFAVDDGDYAADTPDRGYVVDLATGKLTKVLESGGAGQLGDAFFREDTGLLLVPDAQKGVYLLEVSAQNVRMKKLVKLDPRLPPRGVRPLFRFR